MAPPAPNLRPNRGHILSCSMPTPLSLHAVREALYGVLFLALALGGVARRLRHRLGDDPRGGSGRHARRLHRGRHDAPPAEAVAGAAHRLGLELRRLPGGAGADAAGLGFAAHRRAGRIARRLLLVLHPRRRRGAVLERAQHGRRPPPGPRSAARALPPTRRTGRRQAATRSLSPAAPASSAPRCWANCSRRTAASSC